MRVQLLSGGGANDPREQYLTSFVINSELAIDAGALPLVLARDRQLSIRNIIVTHPHLDHLAGLPLMLDNIFTEMEHTIHVYAIEETVQSLRDHIFNNNIWPDFTSFKNSHGVNLQFQTILPHHPFQIGKLQVTAVRVNHTVPTIGLVVQEDDKAIVLSSDTGDTEELWQTARATKGLSAAFIECSYPDRLASLAEKYGHLSTQQMLAQARKIDRNIEIYAYHIKPAYMQEVLAELHHLRGQRVEAAEPGRAYDF